MQLSRGEFNIEAVPAGAREIVQASTEVIHRFRATTVEGMLEVGRSLSEVKDVLPHGQFGHWLECEFGWTDRTARKYMASWEKFKSEQGSVLNMDPSAMTALASDSTPEKARQQAIEMAKTEKVTHKQAQEIIARHRAPKAKAVSSTGRAAGPDVPAPVAFSPAPFPPAPVPPPLALVPDPPAPPSNEDPADAAKRHLVAFIEGIAEAFEDEFRKKRPVGHPFSELNVTGFKRVTQAVLAHKTWLSEIETEMADAWIRYEANPAASLGSQSIGAGV